MAVGTNKIRVDPLHFFICSFGLLLGKINLFHDILILIFNCNAYDFS